MRVLFTDSTIHNETLAYPVDMLGFVCSKWESVNNRKNKRLRC